MKRCYGVSAKANISTHIIHKVLAFILSTFFLVVIHTPVLALTVQEIARKAFNSTVILVMEDTNGKPLSFGSGFFVRDDEIASNLHVIERAAKGYAKIIGQISKYDVKGVIAADPERDLVILKISDACAEAVDLGNSESVQVGETVYAVGNPQGLEGTFSQGIVSSIRKVGNDKLLQITAPISLGSSGGPVLNDKGEVIGVSFAAFKEGQNLNFAIPSNYLRELIGKAGSEKPLSIFNSSTKQQAIAPDGELTGDLKKMQGTWTIKALEKGGEQPPKEVLKATVFFVQSKMTIEISPADSHDGKGFTRSFTVEINSSKKPKTIDLTPLDEPYKGEKLPGIYSIEGNKLKLCVPNGKVEKRPTEMKSPEGSSLINMTLIRSIRR